MLDSEISNKSIPMTYTGLFSTLLTLFIRNHGYRNSKLSLSDVLQKEKTKQMILMLAKFTFTMEQKGRITFTEKDFPNEECHIKELAQETGLIIKLEHEDEPCYQFLHYSFHEFLVALHIFHIRSITDIKKSVYISSMIAGLIGGLVVDSKSNFFVKRYARMFQPLQPLDIKNFFQFLGTYPKHFFLAVVFEYQNKMDLEHLTYYVPPFGNDNMLESYHGQHFLKVSKIEDFIKIDQLSITAFYLTFKFLNEEIHSLKRISSVAHLRGCLDEKSFHGSMGPRDARKFDKVVIRLKVTHHVECVAVKTSFYTNTLELINEPTEMIIANKSPCLEDISQIMDVTIHLNFSTFVNKLNVDEDWKETVKHFCKFFKRFTVFLYDADPDEGLSLVEPHSHDENCLLIENKVAAITEKIGYLEHDNFKFGVSCVRGFQIHGGLTHIKFKYL